MKTINISTLKAKASETLRNVKNGESYLIMDRKYPIAEIIPFQEIDHLEIIKAESDFKWPKPKISTKKDPLDFLLEDRNK